MRELLQPDAYRAVFETEIGEKVLQELSVFFYDIASYTRGDSHDTAFHEGQRSVIRFLLTKLSQIQGDQDDIQA